jgi:hypothetical protein
MGIVWHQRSPKNQLTSHPLSDAIERSLRLTRAKPHLVAGINSCAISLAISAKNSVTP